MKTHKPDFVLLSSDDVFAEGMLASDVGSLWRRLTSFPAVQTVARGLASDPEKIRDLCNFADKLLSEPYDSQCRHPNDIAICASLVILEQYLAFDRMCPLTEVQNLLARIRRVDEPSLIWIREMAEYCNNRRIDTRVPWLEEAIRLEGAGQGEKSLDLIFGTLDDWLLASNFEECSAFLERVHAGRLSAAQLLTILSATWHARPHLPSWTVFHARVKNELALRGENADALLSGFEREKDHPAT